MLEIQKAGALRGTFPSELDIQRQQRQNEPRTGAPSFGETLGSMIQDVDELQKHSHETTRRMLTGQIEDVHQVMVAMEEAQTSFKLMLEVRNKIMEAYKEVIRMQV